MADKKYDDRALTKQDDTAVPKPQIAIVVDGKSIFKPSMKTYFVDDINSSNDEAQGKVVGTYCSCDTVVSTHLICTCESVSTCSCVKHTPTTNPCSCVSYKAGGGTGVCSCQSVSCGSPCACIPVYY